MIQVLNVKVLNESGKDTLFEYTPNFSAANELLLEAWRKNLKAKWCKSLGYEIKINLLTRQRPEDSALPLDIVITVADVLGLDVNKVLGKSRKPVLVEARAISTNIATEAGFTPSEIHESTDFDRAVTYHYNKKHLDWSDIDKEYVKKYESCKSEVMHKLFTK